MLRILVPLDGSENSLKSIEHLIGRRGWYSGTPEIHLINVQTPLPGNVTRFISHEEIRQYHLEEGMTILAAAKAKLDAAGMSHVLHVDVGDAAETIAHYVQEKQIDMIMLGTRGLGSVAAVLLGSVATKIIHQTEVPVLLLR